MEYVLWVVVVTVLYIGYCTKVLGHDIGPTSLGDDVCRPVLLGRFRRRRRLGNSIAHVRTTTADARTHARARVVGSIMAYAVVYHAETGGDDG